MRRSLFAPLALLSIFLLAACRSPDAKESETGVAAVQFADMVVPDGLLLRDRYHESYSREEAGWRFGHFVYTGQPRVDEACAHLLLRMPQHLWKLEADEQPDETSRKLRFSRGRYVADYLLSRQDGLTQMVVEYRTEIEPR